VGGNLVSDDQPSEVRPPPEKDGGFLIENEELKIEKMKH
jgi:hypothetical protein